MTKLEETISVVTAPASFEVVELLVCDIVANYKPLYPEGDDWQKTVEYLYETEPELMVILWDSLRAEGIREPINLSDDNDEPYVLNGTHRVSLALYHGLVTLPARYGYFDDQDNKQYLMATIDLKNGSSVSQDDDTIFDLFRSWPLDSHNWVNADTCNWSATGWELSLSLNNIKLKYKIEEKMQAMILAAFPEDDFHVTVSYEKEYE